MYPAEIVLPMKAELTDHGFKDMTTKADVVAALQQKGTTLVVLNSICGCAAGACRPGALMAVHNATKKPMHLVTSFAGFDIDAVAKLREYLLPYPPSSPAIAMFKDGKLVTMLERHQIEGKSAQIISQKLIESFNAHC